MLDIAPSEVEKVDRSGMLRDVLGLPDQLERALAQPAPAALPPPSRVLIAGMGGSAIGGAYLAAWAEVESQIPVVVTRDYDIPSWVDAQTLVLAVSFSGETEETLQAFVQAKDRGARLAAVSTGGRLQKYAAKAKVPFQAVPAGGQPRAAIGSMLAAQALVLEAAGVLKARAGLSEAAKALRAIVPDLAPDVPPPRNEAKRVALALHGSVPAIYGAGPLTPVATRMANQVHENAKTLAWSAPMPDLNHNELVGWDGTEEVDGLSAVFLRDRKESRAMQERWAFTADTVRKRGAPLIQLEARGEHVLARQLSLTCIGDAASAYLAVRRGIDPSPVDVIADLKRRVGSAGVVADLDRKMG